MRSMCFIFSFIFPGTFECQNLINNTFRFHRLLWKPHCAAGKRVSKEEMPIIEAKSWDFESARIQNHISFMIPVLALLPWELRLGTWPKRKKTTIRMYPAHVGPFLLKYNSAQHYAGLARCWPLAKINAKREKWPLEMLTNNLFTSE